MYKAKIKLVYKQVIDKSTENGFEKAIFNVSYQEFLLKSQAYNKDGKFKTFSKIKANDPRARSLHYKCSFAVGYLIAQLNNQVNQIKDTIGNKLSFETSRFEIIESHTEDISLHKVAISYETDELILIETLGEYMLLAHANQDENEPLETFVVKMQPDLSIISHQQLPEQQIA